MPCMRIRLGIFVDQVHLAARLISLPEHEKAPISGSLLLFLTSSLCSPGLQVRFGIDPLQRKASSVSRRYPHSSP